MAFASIVIFVSDPRNTHENNLLCLTILTELCDSWHAFMAQCLSILVQKLQHEMLLTLR
jgi:hypothetical protein